MNTKLNFVKILMNILILSFALLLLVSCETPEAYQESKFQQNETISNDLPKDDIPTLEDILILNNTKSYTQLPTYQTISSRGYFYNEVTGKSSLIGGSDVQLKVMISILDCGSTHVNGFITKGPFMSNTPVDLAYLDQKAKSIESTIPLETMTSNDSGYYFWTNPIAKTNTTIDINMNLLTTLSAGRMEHLLSLAKVGLEGYEYYKDQVYNEVLGIFDIKPDNISAEVLLDFEDMDIIGKDENNAVLLAASVFLLGPDKHEITLNQALGYIEESFYTSGKVNDEIKHILKTRATGLKLDEIRNNLQKRYPEDHIPPFEFFLDDDADGIINKNDRQ